MGCKPHEFTLWHSKMNDQEIERMLRVMSEPLRKKWETRRYNGKCLLELRKSRESAIVIKENCSRTLKFLYLTIPIAFLCQWFLLPPMKDSMVIYFVCLLLTIIPTCVFIIRNESNWSKQNREIEICDLVFEELQRSLLSLNPARLGNSNRDMIDDKYIHGMAITLARNTIWAQVEFDQRRVSKECGRNRLIETGIHVQKCESDFREFAVTLASDLDIKLDEPYVFREAKAGMFMQA